jgi:hypothetical protein
MSGAGKTTVLAVLSGRGLATIDTDYDDWVLPDGTWDEPRRSNSSRTTGTSRSPAPCRSRAASMTVSSTWPC